MSVQSNVLMYGLDLDLDKRAHTTSDDSEPQLEMGSVVYLADGRRMRYYKFNEAATIGDCVTPRLPDVTVTNLTSATSTSSTTVSDTGSFTADRYNGVRDQFYFATNGGTGVGQIRRVTANDTDDLTIDDAPDTALDTTTDGVVFSPYLVELIDAATEQCCGVCLSSITEAQYGWAQDKGFCPLVQFEGDSNAAAAHEVIVPSGTAGRAMGRTSGGVTNAELEVVFGYALYAYSTANADSRGIAAILDCRG